MYAEARTESEKAAFLFYKAHYAEIRHKFNYLFDRMRAILTPTIFNHICGKIEIEYKDNASYKKWRLKNVLAHIYLVCKGLDDNASAAPTFDFYNDNGKPYVYYFTELLAPNLIIGDTNSASPENLEWPEEVVFVPVPPEPQEPSRVAKPLAPAKRTEPVQPASIEEPQLPETVNSPASPRKSAGDASLLYNAVQIMREYEDGRLATREDKDDFALELYENGKLISSRNMPILTVYSHDGKTVAEERIIGTDFESLPARRLSAPVRLKKDYIFIGWSLSPYEFIDVSGADLSRDFCVFPLYQSEDRM